MMAKQWVRYSMELTIIALAETKNDIQFEIYCFNGPKIPFCHCHGEWPRSQPAYTLVRNDIALPRINIINYGITISVCGIFLPTRELDVRCGACGPASAPCSLGGPRRHLWRAILRNRIGIWSRKVSSFDDMPTIFHEICLINHFG